MKGEAYKVETLTFLGFNLGGSCMVIHLTFHLDSFSIRWYSFTIIISPWFISYGFYEFNSFHTYTEALRVIGLVILDFYYHQALIDDQLTCGRPNIMWPLPSEFKIYHPCKLYHNRHLNLWRLCIKLKTNA